MAVLPLSGFRVGVTADRRGDEQALMLGRLGIEVARGPAITTLPMGNDEQLRALTESLIARPPDYLIANTALGMRSWLGLAATWGVDAALLDALAHARIAARGPKAAGAIGIAGLDVWWRARTERLTSVGERLLEEPLAGKRVAFQLHGDDRQGLTAVLAAAGAEVIEIPVYIWTPPDDPAPALRLVDLCCAGGLDAITFTAGPAVRNFMALAEASGRRSEMLQALNGDITVACIGPVCATAAMEVGVDEPLFPDHWRLGSLVRLVAEQLGHRRRVHHVGGVELVVQGAVSIVDGYPVRLTNLERGVLCRLAARPGATVTRGALLHDVWADTGVDPHVLETTVARLRTKLAPTPLVIETAVRRGYRLGST